MTGLTMPRGLGIVAALAVSGTALYLAYGLKRKQFAYIRKGRGCLRLEYRPVPSVIKDSGVPVELIQGNETSVVEIHCQHLPCLRRSKRQQQQPLLLMPAPMPSQEEVVREKLLQCEADAVLMKSLHTTLTSYRVDVELGERFVDGSDAPLDKFSGTVGDLESCATQVSSSVCEDMLAVRRSSPGDSVVLSSSSCSYGDDCSSKAFSNVPDSPKRALAGCFIGSGSRGSMARKKKVVRFSPSVLEPSSNNQEYRTRFKTQIAQRAAIPYQRSQAPTQTSEVAIHSSIALDRPRLYSQAAKQTITYNLYRGDFRYGGRSCYSVH